MKDVFTPTTFTTIEPMSRVEWVEKTYNEGTEQTHEGHGDKLFSISGWQVTTFDDGNKIEVHWQEVHKL